MNYINDNKTLLIIVLLISLSIIFIVITILQLTIENKCIPCKEVINNKIEKMENQPVDKSNIKTIPYDALYESAGLIQSYNPINNDIIRQYDYKKTFDPLEQPVRRVTRHEIHPLHLKRLIDLPTRGYPDNFTQIGILIREDDNKNKEGNFNPILRLFGRQEFPSSERYEYYTSISSGNDTIKIPLRLKKRELYDDDIIHVREAKGEYRVQLHKYDEPKYYPDILY